MRPLSLRTRMFLLVLALVVFLLAAVSVSAYVAIRKVYLGHIDRMLEIMARAVASELEETPDAAELSRRARTLTESPWKGTGTHFRIWRQGQGGDVASSIPEGVQKARFLWSLPPSARPEPGESRFLSLRQARKNYRAVWVRPGSAGGGLDLLIAHPSSYEHRRLHELLVLLVVVDGGLILLAVLLAGPLARVAIRPVRRTADLLGEVPDRNPADHDLQRLRVPGELQPFVDAVGRLLARLDGVLEHYRQFTGNASHELRTPLSLAQSTLQLASRQAAGPEELRQAIAEASGDLDRMEELIRQLLLLAEVDELREIPDPAEFALDATLSELAAAFDRRAAEAGGRVLCDGLAPVCVRGSEQLVRQLFTNLLGNALRHGPPGGTVHLRLEYASGGVCLAAVEDEGGGLPEADLAQLFERFHRGASARGRKTRGSGLGLAIARQIAIVHGGDIWAATSPGRRTVFQVRLPCTLRADDGRP